MKRISLLRVLEFVAEKRLSPLQVLIATIVIVGLPMGLLYYKATLPRYEVHQLYERFLPEIARDIGNALRENGQCDLRQVRERLVAEGRKADPPAPPIVWAVLDIISKDAEYDGRVICYVPRQYFGRFARTTMCVALERDPREDAYSVFTEPLKGPPDLLREKKTSPQTEGPNRERPRTPDD